MEKQWNIKLDEMREVAPQKSAKKKNVIVTTVNLE